MIKSDKTINYYLKNIDVCIEWAIKKPDKIQCDKLKKEEKKWGNEMIGDYNNGQWTTKLGEHLVYHILKNKGMNPKKCKKKNGFIPDWETEDYIYEVKTRNWQVSGTAGEKVLGTFIKYQSIPEYYNKPLKIICIAYQEYELTQGKINYFGDNISDKTKEILDLAKKWNIEYIAFSEFIK